MISAFPLSFAQPLLLLGLLSLPVLWWLLRVMPPRPQRVAFPPTSRSPWWLTLCACSPRR